MKKTLLLTVLVSLFFLIVHAQKSEADSSKRKKGFSLGIGIKAGLNYANISNASSINGKSQTGFHAGLFIGSFNKSIIGSRTELLYSQQGYRFSSDSTSGSNRLDYIVLAQFLAINITRFVQVQIGGQMAYLLHAKADSSQSTGNASADRILSLYNRLDYGIGGGIEIHPVGGLLIGARYMISLADLYKQPADGSYGSGSVNFKNNVIQLFAGYRF